MQTLHIVWFIFMVLVCFYRCIDKFSSCNDLYLIKRPSSGPYTLYHNGNSIKMYCSFESNVGYTYISNTSPLESFNLSKLYTRKDFVKIRTMLSNGTQMEVTVKNMHSWVLYFGQKNQTLNEVPKSENSKTGTVQCPGRYNQNVPKNVDTMSPYLFLSFLSFAETNQDMQECKRKKYISLYYNPNNNAPDKVGNSDSFMTDVMDQSSSLAASSYMSPDFFFDFEMHMGDTYGKLMTSYSSNATAALGLPFDKCEPLECCNEDDTGCCTSDDTNCTSIAVYVCANDNGMYKKRSERCNIDNRTCPKPWSAWANLGGCSVTCGQGKQYRTRNRVLPCAQINETAIEEYICNQTKCQVFKWDQLNSRKLTFEEKKDMMKDELAELKTILTIDKSNISAAIRRKTSAPDYRISASVLGCFGITLLVISLSLIVYADCTGCCQSKKKSRKKRIYLRKRETGVKLTVTEVDTQ